MDNANSPDPASQGFQQAKDFLAETAARAANRITEATSKAIDTATKTAEKSRDSLSETAEEAANRIAGATDQAVDTVTEVAERTKGSLTEITGKAVSDVNAATSRAADTVTGTVEQARDSLLAAVEKTSGSLEDTIQKAEKLNSAASESVQSAMSSFMDEWIDSIEAWINSHPAVFWLVQAILWAIDHPILASIIVVLLVTILWRLLKVLRSLVDRSLMFVLQAPLKLSRFLLKASSKSLSRLGRAVIKQPFDQEPKENTLSLKALSPEAKTYQNERLASILTRLEVIRQEQNQLLQEVAAIVASDKSDRGGISTSQSD